METKREWRNNPWGREVDEMVKCLLCGSTEEPHRHHVDWNHANNANENTVTVCRRCHVELHRVGYISRDEMMSIRKMVELKENKETE